MSDMVQITDHADRAVADLPQQHKDKTNIEALVRLLCAPIQRLEDAIWQLLVGRSVEDAIGVQQDMLGVIVGQPRDGLSDDDYKRHLRARIATNKSSGSGNELLNIARLVLDESSAALTFEPQYPAAATLKVSGVATSSDTADALASFLHQARGGGIRIILETQSDVDAEMFTLASAAFLAGAESGGSTLLELDGPAPAEWPASGSIDIDLALAAAETVTYSQISNDRTEITCAATANAHDPDAAVQLSPGVGKGFVVNDTITYQSVYSSSNPIGGNLPLSKPSGTVEGDTLVAFIWSATDQITAAPSGWTAAGTVTRTVDGNTLYGYAYVKVAGASEGSSYIWTFDASTDGRVGAILRFDGTFDTQPDVTGTDVSCESGTNHTQSAIDTLGLDTMLVYAWMTDRTGSGSMVGQMVPPGSMTERVDTVASISGRTDMGLMIATEIADGEVTTRVATSTAADIFSTGMRVVLLPGATDGGKLAEAREGGS